MSNATAARLIIARTERRLAEARRRFAWLREEK